MIDARLELSMVHDPAGAWIGAEQMTELTIGTDWGSYLAWNEQIQFNWDDLYNKMGVR